MSQFILAPALLLQYAAKAVPARFSPSLLNRSARIARWFSRRVNRGNELENRGTVLLTEYKHVGEGDEGERILSQWRDPVSQQLYLFRSVWLPHGTQQCIKTKTIAVYVDPTNLRKYWMDLSLLPEAKRRRNASSALPVQLQRLTGSSNRWSFESPDPKLAPLPGGDDTRNRIFISYSREDADRAALLLSRLETAGYEVVSGTTTGEAKVIDEETWARIGLAGTFLMVVPSPAATDLGLKNRELRYACGANRPILPVTFTDSEIPLSMQLSLAGVQRIDLSRDTEAGIQLLLGALATRNRSRVVTAGSVNDLRRASLRGRPRMILPSAMLGAFCWALGSTLSLILLERDPWLEVNALATGLSGLACGGAVGAIFYRPRINLGILLPLTFLFWIISFFLTLVAELAFYSRAVRPSAAGDGGDVGGLTILLATLLGAATLIAGKRVETRVRGYWLKKRGKLLLTEYKGLHYDRSEEHNGDHFIQVVSQWRDPVTDELYTFLSEPFGRDPSQRIRSTSISVFVDPRNFENYQMDLSSSEGGGFTEESGGQTTRDLRSRLFESLDAVVLGVVLFAVSFPVLLLNESYVVRMARSLQEGAKVVVDMSSDRVDPANESKLVHVTGGATTDGSIADPTFGVSAQAIKLRRKVEMYQWQETLSKVSDATGGTTETTYYSPVWSEQPINSGGFKQPQGHRNPPMPFSSVEYVAADVRLGAFKLNPHMVAQLRGADPVDVSQAKLPDSVHARASRLESDSKSVIRRPRGSATCVLLLSNCALRK